jgi:uncharacterized protein HemY
MPKEVQDSIELKITRLEKLKTQDPPAALKLVLELLKETAQDENLFQIAIELSVQSKRTERAIGALFEVAIRHFPKKKDEWAQFIQANPTEK